METKNKRSRVAVIFLAVACVVTLPLTGLAGDLEPSAAPVRGIRARQQLMGAVGAPCSSEYISTPAAHGPSFIGSHHQPPPASGNQKR